MNKIEFGDCRETMRRWKEQGIKAQTCVTSPPYYGLRDYGHDGQIGLEETPEEYIAAMVEVFRCVWDVLEDDGTLWLNIGDSYYNYRPGQGQRQGKQSIASQKFSEVEICHKRGLKLDGFKEKDLIGIPWMLAFALRADGWYLRQDIIWHKPNPMPESVQDRCTKSHEYIFLMSKSQKYYYDHESIKEASVDPEGSANRYKAPFFAGEKHESGGYSANGATHTKGMKEFDGSRNKRSVWTVNTKPYAGAHFAVFPQDLIEPCIMAGAPVGGIVLDPFMGSGTTAQVAQDLGRQYLGCELNLDYKPLQDKRISQLSLELV
ncbi:COG0863 DNA modification methylase [uncultured Caudovirales phage]|uniref:site-specific DNA-methyltransferase (cytosine-N(4)-specific) n=1 Tax=uncultured Caudovirales phage TaxID=2100421 RepID=A0A6J5TBI1_9CAUD|nr:COG0863 DNA modification methylase [uncultured Caudovirales phage]